MIEETIGNETNISGLLRAAIDNKPDHETFYELSSSSNKGNYNSVTEANEIQGVQIFGDMDNELYNIISSWDLSDIYETLISKNNL